VVDTTKTAGDLLRGHATDEKRIWWLSVGWHTDASVIGRRLSLDGRGEVVLGRDEPVFGPDVADPRMSRRHASLRVQRGVLRVADLSSRNGTWLNGTRVMRTKVMDGDVIGVGSMLLVAHRAPLLHEPADDPDLAGESYALGRVLKEIDAVAAHTTPVLVLGESGSGKELVARRLHRQSKRSGDLHTVNCGALSDELLLSELFGHRRGAFSGADRDRIGILESASGGTVLLDEIGDAGPRLQVALLRFLQEGEVRRVGDNQPRTVDTRVVAATHRNLPAMVGESTFREDLLARLAGWTIRIPPLRERRLDIAVLAKRFGDAEAGRPISLSYALARSLFEYAWPRNVRELQTVMRRAVIDAAGADELELSPAVRAMLVSQPMTRGPDSAPEPVGSRRPEPDGLREHMTAHKGNVRAAAKALGVPRPTLYRWLGEAGIDPAALREDG